MIDRDRGKTSVFRTGGYRWFLATVGFTLATCLFVAATVFVLYLVAEHSGHVVASERTRSLFAITLFVSLIAITASLLVVLDRDRA